MGAASSFTSRLHQLALRNVEEDCQQLNPPGDRFLSTPGRDGVTVSLEGPYGVLGFRRESCQILFLVAGGVGISPMVALATEALRTPQRRVHLIWVHRCEAAFWEWFPDLMDALLRAPHAEVSLFCTEKLRPGDAAPTARQGSVPHDTLSTLRAAVRHSRPDLTALLRDAMARNGAAPHTAGVVTCGPGPLMIAAEVAAAALRCGAFHKEQFGVATASAALAAAAQLQEQRTLYVAGVKDAVRESLMQPVAVGSAAPDEAGWVASALKAAADGEAAAFRALALLWQQRFDHSVPLVAVHVLLDFAQIGLFYLQPFWSWDANLDGPVWRWVRRAQAQNPVVARGYDFWRRVFFALVAITASGLYTLAWATRAARRAPGSAWLFQPALRCLWGVAFALVGSLNASCLNLLLVTVDCKWRGAPDGRGALLPFLPQAAVPCLSPTHAPALVLGLLSIICWAGCTYLLAVGSVDTDPRSRALLACSDSRVAVRRAAAKVPPGACPSRLTALHDRPVRGVSRAPQVFLAVAVVVCHSGGFDKLLAIVLLGVSVVLFWDQLRWLPFLSAAMNAVQSALTAMLLWGGLVLVTHLHWPPQPPPGATRTLFYGLLPAASAGAASACVMIELRQRRPAAKYLAVAEVAVADDSLPAQASAVALQVGHLFSSPQQVEICSRCVRQGLFVQPPTPSGGDKAPPSLLVGGGHAFPRTAAPRAAALAAEAILLAGIEQFPDSPALHLLYSAFLLEARLLHALRSETHPDLDLGLDLVLAMPHPPRCSTTASAPPAAW